MYNPSSVLIIKLVFFVIYSYYTASLACHHRIPILEMSLINEGLGYRMVSASIPFVCYYLCHVYPNIASPITAI